jgi:CRISPR type I-E-associated protein CasB/Cse2
MSDLRRSLRDETHSRAWPYISSFCDLTKAKEELLTRTICGLYALHPAHSTKVGNFGASLRNLALRRGGTNPLELHERYLNRLSSAREMSEVCERLPFIVRMMKNEGISVDYEKLHNDLYWWGMNADDRERTPREWCQGYYN